jgi:small subunit ribosomal protein S21
MPGVILKSDDNFEAAYRRFKKQTDRNLIVTEARARRFHETETEKRKKEKISTRKKILKRLFMMRRYESRL